MPTASKTPAYVFAGLMCTALLGAVAGRLSGAGEPAAQTGTAVQTRDLRFVDAPSGDVLVMNADDGTVLDRLQGEQGFIRGTMRGLARTRRAEGVGQEPPFRLTSWSDGRLTLTDSATGRRVELEAFGSENVATFARLLTLPGHKVASQ